jgi:hypothetical protein
VNGPQNYREAKRLADLVKRHPDSSDALALAQLATAHALLANAAATAELAGITADAHDIRAQSLNEWFEVIDPKGAAK